MRLDNKTKFSQYIERKAIDDNCSHMEAIINHCEQTGLEIEMVKTLINTQLKKKIEAEAKALRMLPGHSAKLPL